MKKPDLRNIISRHGKEIVSVSALALFLSASYGAAAYTSVSDQIVGKGRISYDADKDGTAEVLYEAADLTNLAHGIDSLEENVSILSNLYDTLYKETTDGKALIISALNSLGRSVPSDAGYSDIAGDILGMKHGKLYLSYLAGNGTPTSQVPSASNQSAVELAENSTKIALNVDQSVTLPAGYYNQPVTVTNAVQNRGSFSHTWTQKGSKDFPAGYYTKSTVACDVNPTQYNIVAYWHIHDKGVTNKTVQTSSLTAAYEGAADTVIQDTKVVAGVSLITTCTA